MRIPFLVSGNTFGNDFAALDYLTHEAGDYLCRTCGRGIGKVTWGEARIKEMFRSYIVNVTEK